MVLFSLLVFNGESRSGEMRQKYSCPSSREELKKKTEEENILSGATRKQTDDAKRRARENYESVRFIF
jgi:hypothetical protein